ncbi:hypothetical protein AMTRI_Chr05g69640 [Amborella trichopoda]
MRKPSTASFLDVSMLLPFGSGLTACLAWPLVSGGQYLSSTSMETPFALLGCNLWRTTIAASLWTLDITSLLSDIQHLAVMWAYASIPLMAIPNLLLFSSFKDLLFLKHRRPAIRRVWTKPPVGWFKLSFHGSVRGARSGFNGLLCNHNRTLIWSCAGSLHYCEINEAEL